MYQINVKHAIYMADNSDANIIVKMKLQSKAQVVIPRYNMFLSVGSGSRVEMFQGDVPKL